MWKKDEFTGEIPAPQPERVPERSVSMPAPTASLDRATIGRSITIRGDVTGDEDLMIQGRVEGSVDLQQHEVTVGPDGEVSASIVGRVVTIEGRVEGNIDGGEQVILRNSAFVQGDITAPRVVLENGARFRGLVDMGDVADGGVRASSSVRGDSKRRNDNVRPISSSATSATGAGSNGKPATDAMTATDASSEPEKSQVGAGRSGPGVASTKSGKANGTDDTSAELRL